MDANSLRLLVIGGYGTFGGRLVRLLANDSRLDILVGGRTLHKAESFIATCAGAASLTAVPFDRDGDLREQFVAIAPDYVIDASGPWQDYGADPWRVPRTAIATGVHYLDLADSSAFVCGISALDQAARERGVTVIAGLSTCPALTAAVVRELSKSFQSVATVTGGIAPSPYAGMGRSVISAIASYAGKPVAVLEDGKPSTLRTFVSTKKLVIAPPGRLPLPRMVFSLVDLPDLQLLSSSAGNPQSVWFGVATRPPIYSALLRLVTRGVGIGLYSSLRYLTGIMHFFVNRLSWGEHRGGMLIELRGKSIEGRDLSRSWHLVAEGDLGPNVPILACVAMIRAQLSGRAPQPGARPADRELDLVDIEPLFVELGLITGRRTDPAPTSWPLFRRILGDAWHALPAQIRDLHGEQGKQSFTGEAAVVRGNAVLARFVGKLIGIPDASKSVPVHVTIESANGIERWRRNFSGQRFASEYSAGKGRFDRLICERFGPVKIGMALTWNDERLHFVPRRWSLLGIPMPRVLAPSGDISEAVVDGKFQFNVEIRLPFAGHLVTYKGWLVATD